MKHNTLASLIRRAPDYWLRRVILSTDGKIDFDNVLELYTRAYAYISLAADKDQTIDDEIWAVLQMFFRCAVMEAARNQDGSAFKALAKIFDGFSTKPRDSLRFNLLKLASNLHERGEVIRDWHELAARVGYTGSVPGRLPILAREMGVPFEKRSRGRPRKINGQLQKRDNLRGIFGKGQGVKRRCREKQNTYQKERAPARAFKAAR